MVYISVPAALVLLLVEDIYAKALFIHFCLPLRAIELQITKKLQILKNVFYLTVITLNKFLIPDFFSHFLFLQMTISIVFNETFDDEEKILI